MTSVFALMFMAFSGCELTDKSEIKIISPESGTFINNTQDVVAIINSPSKTIIVNGNEVDGGKNIEVNVGTADGLGTIKAEIPGDSLFAFRSFIQGSIIEPETQIQDSITITLGNDTIDGGEGNTVAYLVKWLLENENLEPWINNPLQMDVQVMMTTVTVDININEAISDDVTVSITNDQGALQMTASLLNVEGTYTGTAATINSTGTFHYDYINITGDLQINSQMEIELVNTEVETSEVVLEDSGPLDSYLATLGGLFDDEVPTAIADAAANATESIFNTLISSVSPELALEFENNPVVQTSTTENVAVTADGISITYGTVFRPETAVEYIAGSGILERAAVSPEGSTNISTAIGSRFFNQISFAAWAGNNLDRSYSQGQLENMGMSELDFPYSNLDGVDISLLLPPLLEWKSDGPYLMVGGIEIYLRVSGTDNATAWTAAEIPVKLEESDGGYIMNVDDSREYIIHDAGFNKMSTLVDHDKVRKIMRSAIPGIIDDVFGSLPLIGINEVEINRYSEDGIFTFTPEIKTVSTGDNAWNVIFDFTGVYSK
ncbi:MAG: hypothetical protein JXR95_11580 [Deltaproteobacteria bacterium]|nr:hypothetical protein [Deltaproteobacteria bacterium]